MSIKANPSSLLFLPILSLLFLSSALPSLGYGRRQQQCRRDRETRSRELEEQRDIPYYFSAERFEYLQKTQEGNIRALEKFSSEHLRGIENYRLLTLEANPSTFVVPQHNNAKSIVVVLRGKATITYVLGEKRQSYNLEKGDVIEIPAGAVIYLINPDKNEKLNMIILTQPVTSPGNLANYFVAGGVSFYEVFSNDVLEAALNITREKLDQLFAEQRQGVILKAPQEQLMALNSNISATKQKGQKSAGPFNILDQLPLYYNQFGHFLQASLKGEDISVSYAEIKSGALMVPFYNSKATAIIFVVEGDGYFEMVSPCVSSQAMEGKGEETEGNEPYQQINSNVSAGDVIVLPAGSPFAILASGNQNLIAASFTVNDKHNQRNFLAGAGNVMTQLDREAIKLCFTGSAESIESLFRNQQEAHFVSMQRL
ncbi:hypothetical protein JCGZ_00304 [Jatropha curcas]|uniref:Cupin type-1 domain-containing protein n=1 Tax=Jatropha curcas TaxID=180498 RepID=A0A067L245_JATCU|nr:hypothetical protein JCGZ_00304 [Jatropha curcas]